MEELYLIFMVVGLIVILQICGATPHIIEILDKWVININSCNTTVYTDGNPCQEVDRKFFVFQPADCVVREHERLLFGVGFNMSGRYSLQWQFKVKGEPNWRNSRAISARTATLCYIASAKYTNRLYRCVVTDMVSGEQHVSCPALLKVLPAA